LITASQLDAGLRRTLAEHLFNLRMRDEDVHQLHVAADGDDVDVTAGFAAAPQAADWNELDIGRVALQIGHQVDGRRGCLGQ
jgi:hypothetical protein